MLPRLTLTVMLTNKHLRVNNTSRALALVGFSGWLHIFPLYAIGGRSGVFFFTYLAYMKDFGETNQRFLRDKNIYFLLLEIF